MVTEHKLKLPKPVKNLSEDFLKNPLRSRRFWIAVGTVALNAAVAQYPPLEAVREQLLGVITWLGIALVSGFSLTHAANRVEPIWKSRRFWVAVGTATLNIGIAVYPPLADVQVELIDMITWLGMTIVAGLTISDVALLKGWTRRL